MNRRAPPRLAMVLRSQLLTPHMLRLTFGGDGLADFPADSETANIKLLIPHPEQDWESYLNALAGTGKKPLKRTYTVLNYRTAVKELDVDFALHDEPGPATRWATAAVAGDKIGIAGPGGVKRIDPGADWFLLSGDMSALPAISANIKLLPATAIGYVLLEIVDVADKQTLDIPAGVELIWIINPDPLSADQPLTSAFKALSWLPGTPSIWVAGESNCVRELRNFLAKHKQIESRHRYTSGYWQIGHTEDTHQLVKRNEPLD